MYASLVSNKTILDSVLIAFAILIMYLFSCIFLTGKASGLISECLPCNTATFPLLSSCHLHCHCCHHHHPSDGTEWLLLQSQEGGVCVRGSQVVCTRHTHSCPYMAHVYTHTHNTRTPVHNCEMCISKCMHMHTHTHMQNTNTCVCTQTD